MVARSSEKEGKASDWQWIWVDRNALKLGSGDGYTTQWRKAIEIPKDDLYTM